MSQLRGVATTAEENVIQGSGIAQFSGTRWVEVHALHVLSGVNTDPTASKPVAPVAPSVEVIYANGQVTMSKGPAPTLETIYAEHGTPTSLATMAVEVGFSDKTKIFEGWVEAEESSDQVLQIAEPADPTYVYWMFENRSQP